MITWRDSETKLKQSNVFYLFTLSLLPIKVEIRNSYLMHNKQFLLVCNPKGVTGLKYDVLQHPLQRVAAGVGNDGIDV